MTTVRVLCEERAFSERLLALIPALKNMGLMLRYRF